MSLDEQIKVLTDLLNRVVEVSRSPRPDPVVVESFDELDSALEHSGHDDARMRTYISKLEEAVRRARVELPPGMSIRCFSDLDSWLSQNYWLDFVHR